METLIARQPIFNAHKRLFAYELLYRGIEELSLLNVGGDRATTALLTSSFLTEGLEKIKLALTQKKGPLSIFLDAVIAYERREQAACLRALSTIRVPKENVYEM